MRRHLTGGAVHVHVYCPLSAGTSRPLADRGARRVSRFREHQLGGAMDAEEVIIPAQVAASMRDPQIDRGGGAAFPHGLDVVDVDGFALGDDLATQTTPPPGGLPRLNDRSPLRLGDTPCRRPLRMVLAALAVVQPLADPSGLPAILEHQLARLQHILLEVIRREREDAAVPRPRGTGCSALSQTAYAGADRPGHRNAEACRH